MNETNLGPSLLQSRGSTKVHKLGPSRPQRNAGATCVKAGGLRAPWMTTVCQATTEPRTFHENGALGAW